MERPQHDLWESMFAELKRYKERFGDCEVPDGKSSIRHVGGQAAHSAKKGDSFGGAQEPTR